MLVDRFDKELNISDEVIFIRRKFGTVLERGFIVKLNNKSALICHTKGYIKGQHLAYKIMRPETDVYKI